MTCVSQREKRQDSKPKASDGRKAPRGHRDARDWIAREVGKDGDRARVHTSKFADGLVARLMCGAKRDALVEVAVRSLASWKMAPISECSSPIGRHSAARGGDSSPIHLGHHGTHR